MESEPVQPSTAPSRPPEPAPGAETAAAADAALSDLERAVLDFAGLRWRYAGAKEARIREQFGWSTTRYYQVLGALLERPEAVEYAPMLVARLRRLAEARSRQRSVQGRGLHRDV